MYRRYSDIKLQETAADTFISTSYKLRYMLSQAESNQEERNHSEYTEQRELNAGDLLLI